MKMSRCVSSILCLLMTSAPCAPLRSAAAEDKQPKPVKPDSIAPLEATGTYEHGKLIPLVIHNRTAYLIRPNGEIDRGKRWIWIAPFWLGINHGNGGVEHRNYVERFLAAGFHVAGIDVGTSCGSPAGAAVCHEFYTLLREKYHLNSKSRMIGQSNGGLIAYAWTFRHPECVDRLGNIYPATDFRTWPKLPQLLTYPEPELGYDLTLEELTARVAEFNPIDNLAPLANAGVRILHIHGDKDEVVPMPENSTELARRYSALGGDAKIVVMPGLGHGNHAFYESEPLVDFLLGD